MMNQAILLLLAFGLQGCVTMTQQQWTDAMVQAYTMGKLDGEKVSPEFLEVRKRLEIVEQELEIPEPRPRRLR